MNDKILMGRTNPNGHKLEDLLGKIAQEVKEKTEQILHVTHPKREMIVNNNCKIIELLDEARAVQIEMMENLFL